MPKKKLNKTRVEINIEHRHEEDFELALEEVVKLLLAGYNSGGQSNEDGSFEFRKIEVRDDH